MKGGYVYTVVFTLIVSAVLSTVLAVTYAHYSPIIEEHAQLSLKRAVLNVLGIEAESENDVEQSFGQITKLSDHDRVIYANYAPEGYAKGYAVAMAGRGLWGNIRGFVGVSGDRERLLGIEFTEHNETPGLGGRIDEQWYKDQFRGIALSDGQLLSYASTDGQGLDAITGATSTSNAVLSLLIDTLAEQLPGLEAE